LSTFRLGHAVPCTMIRLFKQLSIQVVFALSLLLSSTAHTEDILLNLGDLAGGVLSVTPMASMPMVPWWWVLATALMALRRFVGPKALAWWVSGI
jgi:hypothetical protein